MKSYVYQKLSNLYIWLAHVAPYPISRLQPLQNAILEKFEESGS